MNEFELIKRFCSFQTITRDDVIIPTGDDSAVVSVPQDQYLAVTTDTMVEGVHFAQGANAYDLGHKILAVNLSDLAAMGATPAWVTMTLTTPHIRHAWIEQFAKGFFALATRYKVQLIGGDLTHGPLSMTIQALGLAPKQQILKRSGAKVGDQIYVSNTIGDASFAYSSKEKNISEYFLTRLHRPEPPVNLAIKLRSIAHAAIDISDGLAADLRHLVEMSNVGADVDVDSLPFSDALLKACSKKEALTHALHGGDDYELCFTIPRDKEKTLATMLKEAGCQATRIGEITANKTLHLHFHDGKKYDGNLQGYQHF